MAGLSMLTQVQEMAGPPAELAGATVEEMADPPAEMAGATVEEMADPPTEMAGATVEEVAGRHAHALVHLHTEASAPAAPHVVAASASTPAPQVRCALATPLLDTSIRTALQLTHRFTPSPQLLPPPHRCSRL